MASHACAVCGVNGAQQLLRCGRCKIVFYCGAEHQRAHWRAGHKEACGRSVVAAVAPVVDIGAWPAAASVLRVPLSAVPTPEAFARAFNDRNVPVVLTGAVDASVLRAVATPEALAALLEGCVLQCRMYGSDHIASGAAHWERHGIVPAVEHVSGHVFASWVRDGTARTHDRYVASCDVRTSAVGALLEPLFASLSQRTGLRVTNFGPQINAWWGGAWEPLSVPASILERQCSSPSLSSGWASRGSSL